MRGEGITRSCRSLLERCHAHPLVSVPYPFGLFAVLRCDSYDTFFPHGSVHCHAFRGALRCSTRHVTCRAPSFLPISPAHSCYPRGATSRRLMVHAARSISSSSSSLSSSTSISSSPPSLTITPWSVESPVAKRMDYSRVREVFKTQDVNETTLEQLASVIAHSMEYNTPLPTTLSSSSSPSLSTLHPFFSRGVVFAHRDFDKALSRLMLHRTTTSSTATHSTSATRVSHPPSCESSSDTTLSHPSTSPAPAYLYTGRGPSSAAMHLGHAIPFTLTCYLQRALRLPVVIQITDDEKYLFRNLSFSDSEGEKRIRDNIKDIIAFGFDPRRTFIFRNTSYMGQLYPTVLALQRAMTAGAVRHTLGLRDDDNIGKFAFAATQAAPCFATCFPGILYPTRPTTPPLSFSLPQCVVPSAVDQDPFFVLARHATRRLPPSLLYRSLPWLASAPLSTGGAVGSASPLFPPPATLYTTFLPSLRGPSSKMSSSSLHAAKDNISMTDPVAVVKRKLRKAFSGGAPTLAAMQQGKVSPPSPDRCPTSSTTPTPPPAATSANSQGHTGEAPFPLSLAAACPSASATLESGKAAHIRGGRGVDLEADVAYQLLGFFVREEKVWREIGRRYECGEIHSGDVKALCALTLEKEVLAEWQARRALVSDADVEEFCSVRPIW